MTLTVTPDGGYELESLTVATEDGVSSRASVTTTEGDEPGTYTFEMPAAAVRVEATFKKATPTGVTDLSTSNLSGGQHYNLMGQPVRKDYKGIVIVNGKKIIVR